MKRALKLIIPIITLLISVNLFAEDKKEEKFAINHGPYIQALGEDQVTIIWTTNQDAMSWVELAPDDGLNFYAEERPKYFETMFGKKNIGKLHRICIKGLSPATKYRYRIFSKSVQVLKSYYVEYGPIASTSANKDTLLFKTLDKNTNTVSFGVVNDIHGNNDNLKNLINGMKPNNNDFYIFNGDMVSAMDSEEQMFKGFIDESVEDFAKCIPFYYCRGNHETRGAFCNRFTDYFPTTTQMPYYSFKQGPCFFLVLDGGEDKPDSDIEYFGLTDFDNYRTDEQTWLRNTVNSEEYKNAKYRIVLLHVAPANSTWHGNLEVKKKFIPILNNANVDLMLCAHLHEFRYSAKGENGLNFPMIINSNVEAVQVKANEKELKIDIIDLTGKTVKKFNYNASK